MTTASAMPHEGAAPDDGAKPCGSAAPGVVPGGTSGAAPDGEARDWLAAGAARLGALPGEGLAATGPADLPPSVRAGHETRGLAKSLDPGKMTLEELERACIVAALERFAGNQAATAGALGISRTTLWRKLRSYGLSEGGEPEPALGPE